MALNDPVGRESELERLGEALDDLERGGNPCIAIEGEAGIGKTWLLSELRRRAEARGHVVLAGSAAEFERDLPFGVWVDALDAYVASQELEPLTAVLRSTGAGDERHRVHRALRALLEEIAERKPLVLVLDDLHWSDPASIELLTALLRRGTAARVLLALGFRSGKAPAKLIAALGAATMIDLGPLSETECARLVGDEQDAAAIYAQSGGNPFFTLQLAHAAALPSRSSSGDRLARDAGVPRVVAATIVEQLESLTANARSLVNAGAVAGDPFDLDLACAAAGCSEDGAFAALDELLARDLVRATDMPRRFGFRHPLLRRAYAYRRAAAGDCARTSARPRLWPRPAGAAARAHHVEQSARVGDLEAVALLREAGMDAATARARVGGALVLGGAATAARGGCRDPGSASICSSRSPMRWRRSGAWRTAARSSCSCSTSYPPMRGRCAAASSGRARPSSICSAATARLTNACRQRWRGSPITSHGRGGVADRARVGHFYDADYDGMTSAARPRSTAPARWGTSRRSQPQRRSSPPRARSPATRRKARAYAEDAAALDRRRPSPSARRKRLLSGVGAAVPRALRRLRRLQRARYRAGSRMRQRPVPVAAGAGTCRSDAAPRRSSDAVDLGERAIEAARLTTNPHPSSGR